MPRQIAVLLTNTDTSAFAQRYPNDAEKVIAKLNAVRPDWQTRVYMARDGELPATTEGLDGVVITGSPASVNDDAAWIRAAEACVQALQRDAVPTVGLCFGHQLIAKALGGRVEQAHDWGLGVGQVQITTPQAWMQPPQDRLTLFAAHQDQVTRLPEGARLLGGSDFCPIGCYLVGHSLLGIQYHPELDRAFMRALLDHIEPHMPPGVVPRARPQVEQPVDADLFFEWMARFLEMPRKAPA